MKLISFVTNQAAFKALQVVKSPKVKLAVLLIAIIAPSIAFAGEPNVNGGG